MLRREFSNALVATPLVAAVPVAHAQTPRAFQDGVDYLTLDQRAAVEAPAGKIEVVEFFWYNCPHCNAFEPKLEAWIKSLGKDVVVRRVPVAFRDEFVPQQRLYYALEALGKLDELHTKVFYAIHVEKQTLNTQPTITAWVEKHGIDKAKFETLYNSFSVSTKARKATQLQDQFKVDGVPALGIAGRYYTSGSVAQSMDRALAVTDHLLAQTRNAK